MPGIGLALEVSLDLNLEIKTELERVSSWGDLMLRCDRIGHPYEHYVLVPYHSGRKSVTEYCSNCHWPRERQPTTEEIRSYQEIMQLEITI